MLYNKEGQIKRDLSIEESEELLKEGKWFESEAQAKKHHQEQIDKEIERTKKKIEAEEKAKTEAAAKENASK